jgi:hypothetical protein
VNCPVQLARELSVGRGWDAEGVIPEQTVSSAEMEWMMKVQEVILKTWAEPEMVGRKRDASDAVAKGGRLGPLGRARPGVGDRTTKLGRSSDYGGQRNPGARLTASGIATVLSRWFGEQRKGGVESTQRARLSGRFGN